MSVFNSKGWVFSVEKTRINFNLLCEKKGFGTHIHTAKGESRRKKSEKNEEEEQRTFGEKTRKIVSKKEKRT